MSNESRRQRMLRELVGDDAPRNPTVERIARAGYTVALVVLLGAAIGNEIEARESPAIDQYTAYR